MSRLPLQFVFQGGGAKLGALVAAATAVHEQREPLGYEIKTISGTSAGAIVACMLASGRIGEFRERLRNISEPYIKKIVKKHHWIIAGWKVKHGYPLYDVDTYYECLTQLFTLQDKTYVYLDDLGDYCDDILIHAVDISNKQPIIYKKSNSLYGNKIKIVDALLDSSALPYIFRTYRNKTTIFDGGLINNFPSRDLVNDKRSGDVIGFSFKEQHGLQQDFITIKEFSKSLISTMIDNATSTAIKNLRDKDVL